MSIPEQNELTHCFVFVRVLLRRVRAHQHLYWVLVPHSRAGRTSCVYLSFINSSASFHTHARGDKHGETVYFWRARGFVHVRPPEVSTTSEKYENECQLQLSAGEQLTRGEESGGVPNKSQLRRHDLFFRGDSLCVSKSSPKRKILRNFA